MNWQVRHQGSSKQKSLSEAQIAQGLRDGILDPLDEVLGEKEVHWQSFENHPTFAAVADEVQAPPPRRHEDPTSLDMNALIDVCLVLLIFFILTTSYASTVQKVVPLPDMKKESRKLRTVRLDDVKNRMIRVQATLDPQGKPLLLVENQTVEVLVQGQVDPEKLGQALQPYVQRPERRELLLDAREVSWATFIAIQDGARAAGIKTIHMLRK